jgi:hypothetical protein
MQSHLHVSQALINYIFVETVYLELFLARHMHLTQSHRLRLMTLVLLLCSWTGGGLSAGVLKLYLAV